MKNEISYSEIDFNAQYKGENLMGKIFSNLKVIAWYKNSPKHTYRWICQCLLCGRYIIVDARSLRSGHTRQCIECGIKLNSKKQELKKFNENSLIGQKFGRTEVIDFGYKKNNKVYWKTKCECGKIIYATSTSLSHSKNFACPSCRVKNVSKKKNYNIYTFDGEIGYCETSNGIFLFDKEDYNKICNKKWNIHYEYVVSGKIRLHRYILDLIEKEKVVDHINHNKLDNRKSNLRITTIANNNKNKLDVLNNKSSGINGVSYEKCSKKWRARVWLNGKAVFSKRFDTKEEAIEARLQKEKEIFGEFALKRGE